MKKNSAKQKLINKVAIVVDASGSMHHSRLGTSVVKLINETITTLKEESIKNNQDTLVSLILFGTSVRLEFKNVPIESVATFSLKNYQNLGGTALIDAIDTSIETLYNSLDGANTSYLVIGITDGEENQSLASSLSNVPQKIVNRMREGNWTFTFNVPNQRGKDYLSRFGILTDNIRIWETTQSGVELTSAVTCNSLGSYYTARSSGLRSVNNFYVNTNMSNVKPSVIKQELKDVKSQFKVLEVPKECQIKEFVESKGYEYQIGNAFYQLTKKETVGENKSVAIMVKGKSNIYTGVDARDIIGLPDNMPAKVTPGNHANYDIFVQSTSTNRKLVRGTKILYKVK